MISLKREIIRIAGSYIGITSDVKNHLVDVYNDNCIELIKPSRKYEMKYTDNWCAMFLSVCASMVGCKDFPYEVSVLQMVKLAVSRGSIYQDYNLAEVGDLIVYNWDGNGVVDHVGIIYSVNVDTIVVLEGNYKSTVGLRTVNKDYKLIECFIKL